MKAAQAPGAMGARDATPTLFARPETDGSGDRGGGWLFGRRTDLWAFGGSATASLALLGLGAALGLLDGETPGWLWLACVLCVDVAHVWTTLFRVYFDGAEVRRRPILYVGGPLLCYVVGVALHAAGPLLFWRVLAYAAVLHFVRQQAGFLALYRSRASAQPGAGADTTPGLQLDRVLDTAAIYAATCYPLCYWHAHPDAPFAWMMRGDFVLALDPAVLDVLTPAYYGIMGAFCARQVQLHVTGQPGQPLQPGQPGKLLLVLSTWACWHLGIVTFHSDYAFTVTNVLIHGVPYFVLTLRYGRMRAAMGAPTLARLAKLGLPAMLAIPLLLAAFEETLWHRHVFHDQTALFGLPPDSATPGALGLTLLVPLLALPQATHYLLDAFIWRRRDNPVLADRTAPMPTAPR